MLIGPVRRLNFALIVALGVGLAVPEPALAQFNPRGRTRKPAQPSKPVQPRARTPQAPAPAPAPAREKPSDEALIKRYSAIVLNQPGAQFPLTRLAQLYRERDGDLVKLLSEFEARVAKAEADPNIKPYNALVALAGIYKQDSQYQKATATYQKAIAAEPNNPIALLALGYLHQDRGDKAAAKSLFDRALPHLKAGADIEQTLRRLMTLSLELDDVDGARKYHDQLVKRAKGSFFVRAELGRELLNRDKLEAAEKEFREVVKAARGDNRALAPALRDLGRALAKQDKREEALKTLQRALKVTASESGLRREILDVIVDVYRQSEQLPELITLLEKEGARDFQRLRLLGGLYEETGRINDAVKTYRLALKQKSKDLEVRLKLVQLLQIQGQLDEAISEYENLIKAAPHNPDFVFQLAEGLLQRGDRKGALEHLTRLERRSSGDDQTLAALVDFYERVGESKRAMALLERLAKKGSGDHHHLVELGNRYYDEGDVEKAKRTWKRIMVVVPNRARALSALGEVYLEHDMPEEALKALEEASKLAPKQVRYQKALALALERLGASESQSRRHQRYERARRIWEQILGGAGDDYRLAQEARQHIVTLWSLSGTMQMRVAPLERNLASTPPDLNSGRLLAEIFMRMRRYPQAERALQRVVEHAPGDAQSHIRLERALVLQRKLSEAIDVLKKLVKIEPKRAREYYQRMAQYAAELYQDDDAIRYASKAVELSPDDARGHQKLGDMHRRRQDTKRAILQYRKAIAKNDRLFPVYFDLAELLLGQGQADEADKLLRRVMRAAVDEDLVARAARLSMQINLGRGTLESLEKELLPVALANPQRPIYRRLLVEVYGALAFPLVQKARQQQADATAAAEANAHLKRIGARAVKPLLDALSDNRDAQQRIAIELLTHLGNKSASAALYAFATGDADASLRVRAMIAAGAPRDPAMLPRFEQLLFEAGRPRIDDGDPISMAAVWGLCRLDGAQATRLQMKLLASDSEVARALSAVSLSMAKVFAARNELNETLTSVEHGHASRAAAAFALGELGVKDSADGLIPLSQSGDDRVRAAALVALARLGVGDVQTSIADALINGSPRLREAALGAATVLATGQYRMQGEPLLVPEGRVRVDDVLQNLHPAIDSADARTKALALLKDDLASASEAAIVHSPEKARWVADALLARGGKPAFGVLTQDLKAASETNRQAAERAADSIAQRAVAPFSSLTTHPSPKVRTTALRFLATRDEGAAQQAVLTALHDSDAQVQRVALAALAKRPRLDAARQLADLLSTEHSWPIRILAAETLTHYRSVQGFAGSAESTSVLQRLVALCQKDEYPLVREAAAKALARLSPKDARPILQQLAAHDVEPRVQQTAKRLLTELAQRGASD